MSKIEEISAAVQGGRAKIVENLVKEALDAGLAPDIILKEGLIAAMDVVGELFTKGDIFVPEMLVSAKAMKKGVAVLKPHLAAGVAGAAGKVIIATVHGDIHDIGKNLVAMMMESAGFEVIDLGVDVPADKVTETLQANPDTKIVALSALLTTTMPYMEDIVKAVRESGFSDVRIMVGGAPINEAFAKKVGADVYAADAATAAQVARQIA